MRQMQVQHGARLIDHKPKSYKGDTDTFIADVARLNGVSHYLSVWAPGRTVNIPTILGETTPAAMPPRSIHGKVLRGNGKVELIFKVGNQYYPHTEHNGELIDAYLHTGDGSYLEQLEGEA